MRCPKCGTENPEGKILCRACGARLRPGSTSAGPPGPTPRESDQELRRRVSYDLIRIAWVMAAVIAAGAAMGFAFK
jgi:uncharacterized membrane protein YvbJ